MAKDGTATDYVSGGGNIYRDDSGTWTLVHTMMLSTNKLLHVQFGDKLIFVNGVDRNIFTDDNGVTFRELVARIEEGSMASVDVSGFTDSNISDWTATDVNINDIVYNISKVNTNSELHPAGFWNFFVLTHLTTVSLHIRTKNRTRFTFGALLIHEGTHRKSKKLTRKLRTPGNI